MRSFTFEAGEGKSVCLLQRLLATRCLTGTAYGRKLVSWQPRAMCWTCEPIMNTNVSGVVNVAIIGRWTMEQKQYGELKRLYGLDSFSYNSLMVNFVIDSYIVCKHSIACTRLIVRHSLFSSLKTQWRPLTAFTDLALETCVVTVGGI